MDTAAGRAPAKIVTIQRHIAEEQALHPQATGELTRLLWDLVLAFKMISRQTSRAGLAGVLGMAGRENVQGEQVTKLDDYAQTCIVERMDHGGHLCCMASEEADGLIPIPDHHPKGKYVLLFDPLDGSSNTDTNASVGTIFSIHRKRSSGEAGTLEDLLQPGSAQVAAGYCVYGSSTMLVYTAGRGVHGFTLDPSLGEFLLSHDDIRMPERGSQYSINEGNRRTWDEGTREYIDSLKEREKPPSLRYIGTLAADFHRTLLKGGIFLYPPDCTDPKNPKPKLRLCYEIAPLAMLAEAAGGAASTGTKRVMDIVPSELHERVAAVLGSREDVAEYESYVRSRR